MRKNYFLRAFKCVIKTKFLGHNIHISPNKLQTGSFADDLNSWCG